jgi:hypothetical protein
MHNLGADAPPQRLTGLQCTKPKLATEAAAATAQVYSKHTHHQDDYVHKIDPHSKRIGIATLHNRHLVYLSLKPKIHRDSEETENTRH